MKIFYLMFISFHLHCWYFVWFPLVRIIAFMYLGKDAYKSFTTFTGMRCHSRWLISLISSRLHEFFWCTLLFTSVHICSMIYELGLWAGLSFNWVTLLSVNLSCVARDLGHGSPSYWKIPPSSKSAIKLSFSNIMYLALFRLPLILTNFLQPSLFMRPQSIRLLIANFIVFFL